MENKETGFIEINGRILDRKKHLREVVVLKEYLLYRFEEAALQQGFVIQKHGRYYNKSLGVSININIRLALPKNSTAL